MATLGISILGLDRMVGKLSDIPARLNTARRWSLDRVLIQAESIYRRKVSGDLLKVRTGGYRTSIGTTRPTLMPNGTYEAKLGIRSGVASKYAAMHEGFALSEFASGVSDIRTQDTLVTIRAKKRLLAIPIDDNLTPAGVARQRSPRAFSDGFWMTTRKDGVFFVRIVGSGKNKALSFLFRGEESVTIKVTKPLGKTLVEIRPLMASTLESEVRKALL